MNSRRIRIFSLLLAAFLPLCAHAEGEYERFNDPFRVYVGGFWPKIDTKISINGDILPPVPPIDVEDILNVQDSQGTFWGGFGWQFANRHALEFEYFSVNREGSDSGTYSPPIELGDTIIEAGAINTTYDTSIARITYGYSLVRNERTDFQLKGGFHIASLEAGIQLAGLICDPTTTPSAPPGCPAAGSNTESADVTAPLPHLGVSYTYAMTPTLAVNGQVMAFAISIDSIDGSIIDASVDLAWQPFRNFGFGTGLRYFNTNVKSGGSELNGEFDIGYFGPTIYVHATF